jgi:methylmalonyl-CoA mutase cobalamin-binding subunit
VDVVYLGRENSARRIAAISAEEEADAVELCLERTGGVLLLRELLRELTQLGRRDVSIVVHRVE